MKRTVLLVLAVLCLVSLFACNQTSDEPRELVFCGVEKTDSDSDFSFVNASEAFSAQKLSYRIFSKKNLDFAMDGTDYKLKYEATYRTGTYPYSVDRYTLETDEHWIQAGLRSDTGALVSFSRTARNTKASAVTPNPELVSEEDFCALAKQFLSDYADVSGWEYSCSTHQLRYSTRETISDRIDGFYPQAAGECESFQNTYTFTFTKRVAGFLSCEEVSVSLEPDGRLCGLSLSCLGETEEFENLTLSEAQLVSAAEEEIRSAYQGSLPFTDVRITRCVLFKSSDGTPCFAVSAEADYEGCEEETICPHRRKFSLYFAAAPGGKLPASLRAD